uniref:ANK_REP_REGION domain-containing protein n=1 Tax=Macrostomum lignano TaxID=282301 RepID=A0A1I8HWR6_9PLAT
MLVDTGSQVTVVPDQIDKSSGLELQPVSQKLRSYGGFQATVTSVIYGAKLQVIGGKSASENIYVGQDTTAILGMNFIPSLDLVRMDQAVRVSNEHKCLPVVRDQNSNFIASFRLRSAPIVPMVKPEGSVRPIRLCGDYSMTLNRLIDVDKYRFPKMEEILAKIPNAKFYTVLDLEQAFLQLVRQVKDRLANCGFKINQRKSQECRREVRFLGFILRDGGMHPDPARMEAWKRLPYPKDKDQLRSALCTFRHYGVFCKNFSMIARPLYQLLKKGVHWSWHGEQSAAFDKLKSIIAGGVITAYDITKPLYLICDASKDGLGEMRLVVSKGDKISGLTDQEEAVRQKLERLAEAGDLAGLRRAATRGNCDLPDIRGRTALMWAAENSSCGDEAQWEQLVQLGDPTCATILAESCLHHAARTGNSAAASALLAAGASANATGQCEFTPLMLAAINTPSATAAAFGRVLLDSGADWSLKNKYGRTALDLATQKEKSELAELLRGGPPAKRCYRCLSQRHLAAKCPFINSKCYACSKTGHIAAACKAAPPAQRDERSAGPQRASNRRVDSTVQELQAEEADEEAFSLHVMAAAVGGKIPPIKTTIDIDGTPVCMEVDTGASVSLISAKTYNEVLRGRPRLERVNTQLRTYSGELVPVLGQLRTEIASKVLPLLVIDGAGSNLVGRDWLAELPLDWRDIKQVQQHPSGQPGLKSLLDKYAEVFEPGLDFARDGRWRPATVTDSSGAADFTCRFDDGRDAHRHVDQVRKPAAVSQLPTEPAVPAAAVPQCDAVPKGASEVFADGVATEAAAEPDAMPQLRRSMRKRRVVTDHAYDEEPSDDEADPHEEEDFYPVTNPQGFCLIINISEYDRGSDITFNFEERQGSDRDVDRVKRVFESLRFIVRIKNDLTVEQVDNFLNEIKILPDLAKHGSFVCFLMAHGSHDCIYGRDGFPYKVRKLTGKFKACRGSRRDRVDAAKSREQTDEAPAPVFNSAIRPPEGDFLLCYATTEGSAAFRNIDSGSRYVQTACEFIEKYFRELDLITIMT